VLTTDLPPARSAPFAVTDLSRTDLAKWQAVVKATGVKPE